MCASREWVSFRVKPAEYEHIEKHWKSTTCRSLSEYARKMLLAKPVVVKYRNESADQYLEEMILLKNELSAIGNNFNQAVKRLHTLDTTGQMRSWLIVYESTHHSFIRKVDEIKERLNQIYELWLSK
ncbi:MAG TPA: plasmid mobilization relaxosome protein MobC [Puia sp.]